MTDIDYGELFGIGEQADPAPAGDGDGGTGPTSAGAAETPGSEADIAGKAEKSEEPAPAEPEERGGKAPAGKQGDEENARYAAARRKAERERDEAIAAARAEMQREMDETFAKSGMVNPYTKKPITSKAEYDEYRARYDEEQASRVRRKSGMSDDEFNKFIDNLPQVREARQKAEEAERAQAEAREQAARARVDEQIREIGAMDPGIKSIDDLTKMDNYEHFYELVKRGNTLTDAYRLANFDRLVGQTAAAGRQAAINAAAGKAHMGRTSSRGQGAVAVPADVVEQYRVFLPDATDAEIQAHYSRYHKK